MENPYQKCHHSSVAIPPACTRCEMADPFFVWGVSSFYCPGDGTIRHCKQGHYCPCDGLQAPIPCPTGKCCVMGSVLPRPWTDDCYSNRDGKFHGEISIQLGFAQEFPDLLESVKPLLRKELGKLEEMIRHKRAHCCPNRNSYEGFNNYPFDNQSPIEPEVSTRSESRSSFSPQPKTEAVVEGSSNQESTDGRVRSKNNSNNSNNKEPNQLVDSSIILKTSASMALLLALAVLLIKHFS